MKSVMSKEMLEVRTEVALSVPMQQHCGLKLIRQDCGYAEAGFTVSENTGAPGGTLHGGVLYAMMDATSLLSLLPLLDDKVFAVIHNVTFSLMNAAFIGNKVNLKARVMKRGKKVAFMNIEAWTFEGDEERQIAQGTVTKSIVPVR